MRCSACGGETPDGKRFCKDCGGPLIPLCASCGTELLVGSRFCADCGTPVGSATASPVVVAVLDPDQPGRADRCDVHRASPCLGLVL